MVLARRQHEGHSPADGVGDHASFRSKATPRPAQRLTFVALF